MFSAVRQVQARSLATRCRALVGPDDSRIGARQSPGQPRTPNACDHEFGLYDSYVRHRLIRWSALRPGNKNPRRNCRRDAGGETCSLQNSGSVGVAKEYARAQSPSSVAVERDPQRIHSNRQRMFRKANVDAPHLNPLPASGAKRGSA